MAGNTGSTRGAAKAFKKADKALIQRYRGAANRYSVPLYALVGPEESDKDALLEASGLPGGAGGGRKFEDADDADRWWMFDNGAVISLDESHFSGDPATEEKPGFFRRLFRRGPGGRWHRLLESWMSVRRHRPIDGIVVALPLKLLLDSDQGDKMAERTRQAERLAERVHDIQITLGVQTPVYVILTGSESLPGFAVYASALDMEVEGAEGEPPLDQMLGWSSPYTLDTPWKPERVTEALSSVREAINVHQLDLIPRAESQWARDALYLLPDALKRLERPLRMWLDPLCQSTAYRRGLPLRGIYLTGRPSLPLEEGGDVTLGDPVEPVFVRQLFAEKIFVEPGLARVDEQRTQLMGRRVRGAQFAFGAAVLLGALGVWGVDRAARDRAADVSTHALPLLKPATTADEGANAPTRNFSTLAGLSTHRMSTAWAPTTLLDPLDERLEAAIATALERRDARPLKDKLDDKARTTICSKLSSASGRFRHLSETGRLARYVDQVNTLQGYFDRLKDPERKDLVDLYVYLYAEPGSPEARAFQEVFQTNSTLYEQALVQAEKWPLPPYADYQALARDRLLGSPDGTRPGNPCPDEMPLADAFMRSVFADHPLRNAVQTLQKQVADLSTGPVNNPTATIEAINASVDELITLVRKDRQADWLAGEAYPGGEDYKKILKILDAAAFTDGPALSEAFDLRVQGAYRELRNAVRAPTPMLGGGAPVVEFTDEGAKLSAPVVALKQALDDYTAQPYVLNTAGEKARFRQQVAEAAASADGWNADLLSRVLTLDSSLEAYLGAERDALRGPLKNMLDRAAQQQFRLASARILEKAIPPAPERASGRGQNDVLVGQQKALLKNRVRNVAEQTDQALKVATALDKVDQALKATDQNPPVGVEVVRSLDRHMNAMLRDLDVVLREERLYRPNALVDDFWAQGLTPGVVIFGAQDINDLAAWLEAQRISASSLAYDYAEPLLGAAARMAEAPVQVRSGEGRGQSLRRWRKVVDVLQRYDKQVPGNAVESLEKLILTQLNELTLNNCLGELKKLKKASDKGNYFAGRRSDILEYVESGCRKMLQNSVRQRYEEVARLFKEELAGRFPFSAPEAATDADPRAIVNFYQRFDPFIGALEQLATYEKGRAAEKLDDDAAERRVSATLFGQSATPIRRFSRLMREARPLFAEMITSQSDPPEFSLEAEVAFRVNRESEAYGNQIIDWSATIGQSRIQQRDPDNEKRSPWRLEDPVQMCFRWAKDGPSVPSNDQPSGARVEENRTACFLYKGRWAILRLLTINAATPADRGRSPFLMPHVLRFDIETTRAGRQTGIGRLPLGRTRVYNRVSLKLPNQKGRYTMPVLPRVAPEVAREGGGGR